MQYLFSFINEKIISKHLSSPPPRQTLAADLTWLGNSFSHDHSVNGHAEDTFTQIEHHIHGSDRGSGGAEGRN